MKWNKLVFSEGRLLSLKKAEWGQNDAEFCPRPITFSLFLELVWNDLIKLLKN